MASTRGKIVSPCMKGDTTSAASATYAKAPPTATDQCAISNIDRSLGAHLHRASHQ